MPYTTANYADVEPVAEGMYFMRDVLEADRLGFTVLECEPGWEGMSHDHAGEAHEEIYYLVDGAATIVVDGEDVPLEPGDAIRVDHETERQIRVDDVPSRLVLVGST